MFRAVLRVLPKRTPDWFWSSISSRSCSPWVDDETRRTRFLAGLVDAVQDPHRRVKVIFTLRADFYDRPLAYPDFGARMGEGSSTSSR